MGRRAAVLAVILSAGAALAGDEAQPGKPKSPAAVNANNRHDVAVNHAQLEYQCAIAAADKQLLADLDDAMKAAMKAENVEEIKRIDAERKELAAKINQSGIKFTLWHLKNVTHPSGAHVWLRHDGAAITDSGDSGKWSRRGNQIRIQWRESLDVWNISSDGKTFDGTNNHGDKLEGDIMGTNLTGADEPPK